MVLGNMWIGFYVYSGRFADAQFWVTQRLGTAWHGQLEAPDPFAEPSIDSTCLYGPSFLLFLAFLASLGQGEHPSRLSASDSFMLLRKFTLSYISYKAPNQPANPPTWGRETQFSQPLACSSQPFESKRLPLSS